MISSISRHFPNLVWQEQVLLLVVRSLQSSVYIRVSWPSSAALPASGSQYIREPVTGFKTGGQASFIQL